MSSTLAILKDFKTSALAYMKTTVWTGLNVNFNNK